MEQSITIMIIKYPYRTAIITLCALAALGASIGLYVASSSTASAIEAIRSAPTLALQVKEYRALMERIGLEEAQEQLVLSGLPFTGQTHLLNHTSGEYAYQLYGKDALLHCKDYFLSSCYHGALISLMASEGVGVIPEILNRCKAQGGTKTYVQCVHAVGHGYVAWFGYAKLPQALETCDRLSLQMEQDFPLFSCHDGAFMENVWAVHDGGAPSPDRWVKKDDNLFPCNSPEINDGWKSACWANQPALLFQQFEGNTARVATVCEALADNEHRGYCLNGLARQIHPLTKSDPHAALSYCNDVSLLNQLGCVISIASADYSVGGRELPFSICGLVPDTQQDVCYREIMRLIEPSECGLFTEEERQAQCETGRPAKGSAILFEHRPN